MQAWWQRDQIISAFIIGSFSMTATLISVAVNARRAAADKSRQRGRKPRRNLGFKRVPLLFVAGLAAGALGHRIGSTAMAWLELGVASPLEARVTAGAAHPSTSTAAPRRIEESPAAGELHGRSMDAAIDAILGDARTETVREGVAAEPAVASSAADEAIAGGPAESGGVSMAGSTEPGAFDPAVAAAAESDTAVAVESALATELSDWLYATGSRIHYRYADRLPDACEGETVALGNWVDGRKGVPVECIDDAWLVIDLGELLASGRLTRNATYCFTLRSASGEWARHDAVPAPGIERVAIVSKSDFWGSRPLGFRVLRTDGPDRVEFGNEYPRVLC